MSTETLQGQILHLSGGVADMAVYGAARGVIYSLVSLYEMTVSYILYTQQVVLFTRTVFY